MEVIAELFRAMALVGTVLDPLLAQAPHPALGNPITVIDDGEGCTWTIYGSHAGLGVITPSPRCAVTTTVEQEARR